MANHTGSRLHRYFHLTTIVMICQGLLASRATAFSSLATWHVSPPTLDRDYGPNCRSSRHPHTRTTSTAVPGTCSLFLGGGKGLVRNVSVSHLPRGSSTALEALPASRRASALALQKMKTQHWWWQPMWTKICAVGNAILGELRMLTWKQHVLMLTVFLAGISIGRSLSTLTWSRFCKVEDIPPTFFGPSAPCLKGRAVSVSDGDTFRFYHTPTSFHKSTLDKKTQGLVDHTLLVRLCTIDTPETAKFGKPAQPFAEQAKQELKRLIEDRIVRVRLLTKDQYGRVVGQVMVPPQGGPLLQLFRKKLYIEEVLLQAGLAEVYQGMGAAYGHKGKDYYLKLEHTARQSKQGQWALSQRESAADYKRRTKKDT